MHADASSREAPTTPAPDARRRLTAALADFQKRLETGAITASLIFLLALAMLIPLLAVVLDHLWVGGISTQIVRWLLPAWLAAIGIGVVTAFSFVFWRRLSIVFVAQSLEKRSGIPHNAVVNAVLLPRMPTSQHAVDAAAEQATTELGRHPAPPNVEPQRLGRAVFWLITVIAAWLAYSLLAPKPVSASLARFFGARIEAPTATMLTVISPSAHDVVHAGEAVTICVRVDGAPVDEVVFETRDPAAQPPRAMTRHVLRPSRSVDGPDERTCVLTPAEVQADIHYRCFGGDARIAGKIRVQPRPRIDAWRIRLTPPAYTGRPAFEAASPQITVLDGTEAEFVVRANVSIREPVFVWQGEDEAVRRVRMTVGDTERSEARITMVLRETGRYRIEFLDEYGYMLRDDSWHRLTIKQDDPPRIELIEPDAALIPNDEIDIGRFKQLAALAEDDFGVHGVWLVVRKSDMERREAVSPGGNASGTIHRCEFLTAALDLPAGEKAEAWFEVADGRVMPDGSSSPQSGRSRVFLLVHHEAKPDDAEQAANEPAAEDPQDAEPRPSDDAESMNGEENDDSGGSSDSSSRSGHFGADAQGEGQSDRSEEGGDVSENSQKSAEQFVSGDDLERQLDEFMRDHAEEIREVSDWLNQQTSSSERSESQAGGAPLQEQSSDASADRPPSGEETNPDSAGESRNGTSSRSGNAGAQPENAAGASGHGAESPPRPREPGAGPAGGAPSEASAGIGENPGSGGGQPPQGEAPAAMPPVQTDLPEAASVIPPETPRSALSIVSQGALEAVNMLDVLRRAEQITEDRLIKMGWPAEKAAAFVKDLERIHRFQGSAHLSEAALRRRFDPEFGETSVQTGGRFAEGVSPMPERIESIPSRLKQIAPPAEQFVSPHLREVLDAYYRAMSEYTRRAAVAAGGD